MSNNYAGKIAKRKFNQTLSPYNQGEAIQYYRSVNKTLQDKIDNLNFRLASEEASCKNLETIIASYEEQIKELQEKITELRNHLDDKNDSDFDHGHNSTPATFYDMNREIEKQMEEYSGNFSCIAKCYEEINHQIHQYHHNIDGSGDDF